MTLPISTLNPSDNVPLSLLPLASLNPSDKVEWALGLPLYRASVCDEDGITYGVDHSRGAVSQWEVFKVGSGMNAW
jgi:hypothetical protein